MCPASWRYAIPRTPTGRCCPSTPLPGQRSSPASRPERSTVRRHRDPTSPPGDRAPAGMLPSLPSRPPRCTGSASASRRLAPSHRIGAAFIVTFVGGRCLGGGVVGVDVWWWGEFGEAVGVEADGPLSAVDAAVVSAAEQDGVVEVGVPAGCPGLDVVCVAPAGGSVAVRKRTPFVGGDEGAAYGPGEQSACLARSRTWPRVPRTAGVIAASQARRRASVGLNRSPVSSSPLPSWPVSVS